MRVCSEEGGVSGRGGNSVWVARHRQISTSRVPQCLQRSASTWTRPASQLYQLDTITQ